MEAKDIDGTNVDVAKMPTSDQGSEEEEGPQGGSQARHMSLLRSLGILVILSVLLALILSFLFRTHLMPTKPPPTKVGCAIKAIVYVFREIGQSFQRVVDCGIKAIGYVFWEIGLSFQRVVEHVLCHVLLVAIGVCFSFVWFPFKLLRDGNIMDFCMLFAIIMIAYVWRLCVVANVRQQQVQHESR
jgi:hypothetical protein